MAQPLLCVQPDKHMFAVLFLEAGRSFSTLKNIMLTQNTPCLLPLTSLPANVSMVFSVQYLPYVTIKPPPFAKTGFGKWL